MLVPDHCNTKFLTTLITKFCDVCDGLWMNWTVSAEKGVVELNTKRTAEVWLDEYKRLYYTGKPADAQVNIVLNYQTIVGNMLLERAGKGQRLTYNCRQPMWFSHEDRPSFCLSGISSEWNRARDKVRGRETDVATERTIYIYII